MRPTRRACGRRWPCRSLSPVGDVAESVDGERLAFTVAHGVRIPVAGAGRVLRGARGYTLERTDGLCAVPHRVDQVLDVLNQGTAGEHGPHDHGAQYQDGEGDENVPDRLDGAHASTHARTARTWSRMAESVTRCLTVSVALSMPSGSWLSVRWT